MVKLTEPYADAWMKWLAEQIFSLKRDLPYKIVTKVADFQIEKARASTRSTTSPVVLYFLLTSLLQNPYADTNNFYIFKAKKCKTWATLNSFDRFFFFWFWPRFADNRFKFGTRTLFFQERGMFLLVFWRFKHKRGKLKDILWPLFTILNKLIYSFIWLISYRLLPHLV